MEVLEEVKEILGECLSLGDRTDQLTRQTRLLGGIPEFDSMAVVSVLTAIEERFGLAFDDDEITAEIFASVDSLCQFVEEKIG
jgi:acyl carrier protein